MKEYYPPFFQQTREILVREIGCAQRWSAIEDAALALLKVIRIGESMKKEAEYLDNTNQEAAK